MLNGISQKYNLRDIFFRICTVSFSSPPPLFAILGALVSLALILFSGFTIPLSALEAVKVTSMCPIADALSLFDTISSIISYSSRDIVSVVAMTVLGLSYFSKLGYSIAAFLSSFKLVLDFGATLSLVVSAPSNEDADTTISLILVLIFGAAISIVKCVFCVMLYRISGDISQHYINYSGLLFLCPTFYNYIFTNLIFLGAILLLRSSLAFLLRIITVV